jgi:phosphoribosyl 1,2-cyclic phosphodiesterase
LTAIVVTHEHGDHIDGVAPLARKFDLPVWLTYGTLRCLQATGLAIARINIIDNHAPFTIGDIEVCPYAVPHDAREPAQYVFSDGDRRLGVLTDAGSSTPHMCAALGGVDALVLECNHDMDMLDASGYPESLKRRIAGRYGHLDNSAAAGLLKSLDARRLQHLIAAHLSQQNNTPELAQQALAGVLGCDPGWIGVACQDQGFGWRGIA